jgi:sec-independent protein translocase protein TatA
MGLDNPLHIAFLLIVVLMVFGAKRLPEMGRSLGSGMRSFKDAINPDANVHAALAAPPQAEEAEHAAVDVAPTAAPQAEEVEHAAVEVAPTAAPQAVPAERAEQERAAA